MSESPDTQLQEHATALADALEAALAGWVVRCVTRVATGVGPGTGTGAGLGTGTGIDATLASAAAAAGERCRDQVGGEVRRLLATDVDAQRTTPLTVIRGAVSYPTAVLSAAGIPPVARDAFAVRAFPDDAYDLTPASFAEVDAGLAEPALVWGAAKAFVHRRRHRAPD